MAGGDSSRRTESARGDDSVNDGVRVSASRATLTETLDGDRAGSPFISTRCSSIGWGQ
jgi:hypothetical protein